MNRKSHELVDFIFAIIRHSKEISLETLGDKYEVELNHLNCDSLLLEKVLIDLEKDEKIFKSGSYYRISPKALTFKGYDFEMLQKRTIDSKNRKKDWLFKIIPITCTIIFGASTLYFNYTNREKDKKIKEYEKIIFDKTQELSSLKTNSSSPSVLPGINNQSTHPGAK